MATGLREVLVDRNTLHSAALINPMADFVEIVEHPLKTGDGIEKPGRQSRWRHRPVSLTPRSFISNSPLKVRKTRENLRAGRAERHDDAKVMYPGGRDLVNEKPSTQGRFSIPVSMDLASALSITPTWVGDATESLHTAAASTSSLESTKIVAGDFQKNFELVRRTSQRVVTKIRKLSLKGKVSAIAVLQNRVSGSRRPSARQISKDSQQGPTGELLEHDTGSTSFKKTPIRQTDHNLSCLSSPHSTLLSRDTSRVVSTGNHSTPPSSSEDGPVLETPLRSCVQPLTAMSRAILTITPEIDAVDLATEGTIWTLIQIEGDALVDAKSQYPGYRIPSLAVAVVVDTSSFTSGQCFERASEQVLNIAKLLQCHGDQIAVYFTSSRHHADGKKAYRGHEISALQAPDVALLRQELAVFKPASPDNFQGPELRSTILQAADDLNRLGHAEEFAVRTAQREIVLIASHAFNLTEHDSVLKNINLHLISPGIIPFQGCTDKITGWLLNSDQLMPATVGGSEYSAQDMQSSCLAALLTTARYATHAGSIKNMRVDIEPGPDTMVEEVIGHQHFAELLPGQTIRILVKLRVPVLREMIRERRAGGSTPNGNIMSIEDAFLDLETVLDELFRELVKVQINYTHSKFPDNTHISVKETCWIRRPSALQLAEKAPITTASKKIVQMSLAMSLAARSDPSTAMAALEKIFDAPDFHCTIRRFLGTIKSDLHFQSAVLAEKHRFLTVQQQRLDAAAHNSSHARSRHRGCSRLSGSTPPRPLQQRPLQLRQSDTEYATTIRNSNHVALVRDQQYATQVRSKDYTAEVQSSEGTKKAQDKDYSTSIESSSTDRAQRIWRQMRQLSKGSKENAASPSKAEGDEQLSETMLEIQRQAVKNKRSIGADTLRSMARSLGIHGRSTPSVGDVDDAD